MKKQNQPNVYTKENRFLGFLQGLVIGVDILTTSFFIFVIVSGIVWADYKYFILGGFMIVSLPFLYVASHHALKELKEEKKINKELDQLEKEREQMLQEWREKHPGL